MQEPRQLRNQGGIMEVAPRQGYVLGKLVKGVKKGVKGLAKGAKKILKSDAGKLGLLALGAYGLGGAKFLGGKGIFAGGQGLGRFANLKNLPGAIGKSLFSKSTGDNAALKNFGKIFLGGAALGGGLAALSGEDEEVQEVVGQDVPSLQNYLTSYYQNLGYNADQIAENVVRDTSEYVSGAGGYADGGRIGYAFGDKVEMASGIEGLPININPKGVKELDLRETGGFIPPVGVKEKADDIPAMLSNNEFVFTADAVRAAGGGSVNKGAQIMYDTMKKLESKVV